MSERLELLKEVIEIEAEGRRLGYKAGLRRAAEIATLHAVDCLRCTTVDDIIKTIRSEAAKIEGEKNV